MVTLISQKEANREQDKLIKFPLERQLKDETPVLFRLIEPNDKDMLIEGYQKLSAQSRRYRCFIAPSVLSDSQVSFLTEVDNKNHLAVSVRDLSREDQGGIGIARYIRLEGEPQVAEFAITVIDEYQNRGLGRMLLKVLIQAAQQNGIRTFRAYVMAENLAMMTLLQRLGGQIYHEEDSLLRIELHLDLIR